MKKGIVHIILNLFLLTHLIGQISPGDLTAAHAELEGIRNCTQCHDLGHKVTNKKCLACHEEIQALTDLDRGYHASKEVKGKDCAEWHSEHHGRNFDMSRFDEDNFDHDLTGYELTGGHLKIDCRECHIPDFIADKEIKKREDTFLGLEHDCISCHEDVHQNTLSTQDCASCHDTEAFAPATYFDHDDTEYPLTGKHVEVECIECHQKETRNGKEFQVFTGLEFNNCISCHDDVHENNLGTNCKQCHSTESFTSLRRIRRFNHNSTNFPLKGAHQQTDCFECGSQNESLVDVFQDRMGIKTNDCIECHDDVHEGKFGTDCIRCHSEESFYSLKEMDLFDHSVTDYPLEGQHAGVDCKSCHTERLTEAIDHSQCKNCHQDYHNGEFMVNGDRPDCIDCHILEEKFTFTTYGFEEHNASSFPLEGAHMATPCFACHVDEEHWSFRNIGQSCVDCHDDIHQDYLDVSFYPDQDCTACHNSENWHEIAFDHQLTEWPLTGAHNEVDCRSCHFETTENPDSIIQSFTDLGSDCIQCHSNIHGDQFEIDNVTDCARCHVTESWQASIFDHNTTNFPLDGKHIEVDCKECHNTTIQVEGEPVIIYAIEKYECIDCHL